MWDSQQKSRPSEKHILERAQSLQVWAVLDSSQEYSVVLNLDEQFYEHAGNPHPETAVTSDPTKICMKPFNALL